MRVIDIPVNIRLTAAVLVPLVVLVMLGASKIYSSYEKYVAMEAIVETTEDIHATSNLIHMLQVERGTTAGFLGSKGQRLASELGVARQNVDAALAEFRVVEEHDSVTNSEVLTSIVNDIEQKIALLADMRKSISALTLQGSESFKYYNETIERLSDFINHEILLKRQSSITVDLVAYSELLAAKELAGQERGIGAGVIGAGKFDEARYTIFLSKGGAQKALLNRYLALQPHERAEIYRTRFQQSGSAELDALRKSMVKFGLDSDLSNLNPKDWFTQATKQITLMKEIENENITQISSRAKTISNREWRDFLFVSGFTSAAFIIAVIVAMSLAKTVTIPLKSLCKSMNDLVNGITDAHLIHAEGKDEIGQMGTAVKAYIEKAKKDLEQQADEQMEREEQKTREQQELDRERAEKTAEIETAMTEIGKGLQLLANGDISHQIEKPFSDALDPLRKDYNETARKLNGTISSVKEIVDVITASVGQLEQASENLSMRTDQQASSLKVTTTALGDVSGTVQNTSANAEKAGDLVQNASQFASESSDVVDSTIEAISQVESSSSQISEIISVIDEIAFQTNLLALNAGVEAARAGEAGKGFAVVAEEVRELAQRSATAAKEIKELIGRSSIEVNNSVGLVNQTGSALKNIAEQVNTVNAEVLEIVSSTRMQTEAISEINETIAKLEHVTNDNATMVASNKQLTSGLVDRARALSSQVDYFSLSTTETKSRAA